MRAGASYPVRPCVLVRRLTNSDLGLFYAKRPQLQSKQRAININAEIVSKIFGDTADKEIMIRCLRYGSRLPPEERPLGNSGKNWRLGDKAIRDEDLAGTNAGDYFTGLISTDKTGETMLRWQVISTSGDPVSHQAINRLTSSLLRNSMAVVPEGEAFFEPVRAAFFKIGAPKTADLGGATESSALELREPPAPGLREAPPRPLGIEIGRAPRKRSIRERIRSPHIMEEMLQVASGLSGRVQQEFFDTAVRLAELLFAMTTDERYQRMQRACGSG